VLPDSKDALPKFLCLDPCKWIELARAYYRKPGGELFHDALTAVQKAVASGKLVIPFSLVNAVETATRQNRGQRSRLAKFLVRLSRGNAILPFTATIGWEMKNALGFILKRGNPIHIRYSLIRPGIGHALGKRLRVEAETPAMEAAVVREELSPRATLSALRSLGDTRELTEQMHDVEVKAVAMFEGIRAWATSVLTPRQQRGHMLAELLSKGEEGRAFRAALRDVQVTQAEFQTHFASPEDWDRFLERVPALNVLLTLGVERDQNADQRIKRNDIRDLAWLAVALPYANLVVSEKNWGHLAKATRLHERYGTTVIFDTSELPQRLAEMGCL
jgi:hypothetical protein